MNPSVKTGGYRVLTHRVRAFVEFLERQRELPPRLRPTSPEAPADPALVRQALDRLRREHEELAVAEEELRVQLDTLASLEHTGAAERAQALDLFNMVPGPLLVSDRAAVVSEANLAAAHMFSIASLHLRGKPLVALVDQEDRRAFLDLLARVGEGSAEATLNLHGRRGARARVRLRGAVMGDGKRILWSTREAEPPADGAGERAEIEALRLRLRELEALSQREREALEALEAQVRAKDRSLALLAHELRGPMNIIIGWAKLLREDASDAEQRGRALATIERNAQAQSALVHELLDVTAIAAGTMKLRFELVDVGALARELAEGLRPVADEQGLRVSCVAPDGLAVLGDAARLRQVVSTLLSQAVRATPRGGRVELRCAPCDDDPRAVELVVEDDGRGLSEAALGDLFRFFPHPEDGTRLPKGITPALYLVQRLLELHGGTVRAESEGEGRGTCFRVRLPAMSG